MNITHEQTFQLPNRRGRPPAERFGQGGHGMCFCPSNGTLLVTGNRLAGSLVAEVTVPEPGEESVVMRDFFDARPGAIKDELAKLKLDRLGDICLSADESLLYSVSYRYYGVQPPSEIDHPTLVTVRTQRIPRMLLAEIPSFSAICAYVLFPPFLRAFHLTHLTSSGVIFMLTTRAPPRFSSFFSR